MTAPSNPAANAAPGWAPAGILRAAGDAPAAGLGPNQAPFPLSGDEMFGLLQQLGATVQAPGS
jgi:hypothetical protein